MKRSATFSSCGKYRYTLTRTWDEALPVLAVIGHNPSTADAEQDDPTIRRCLGFARRDGFGALLMVNLCAWRATAPEALHLLGHAAVGPDNDTALLEAARLAGRVVAAWGSLAAASPNQAVRERPRQVLRMLAPLVDVWALKVRSGGAPAHPLYLPADTRAMLYRPRAAQG